MKIKKKNYKGDIKILVNLGNDYNNQEFQIIFTTGNNPQQYVCSHFGTSYKNCVKVDAHNIMCLLDNHNLRPGMLYAETAVYVVDPVMPDGTFKKVSNGAVVATIDNVQYNIELVVGNDDEIAMGQVTLDLLASFIKGNDGQGFVEAPDDGKKYVRKNKQWVEETSYASEITAIKSRLTVLERDLPRPFQFDGSRLDSTYYFNS